ncbi:MAG: PQQ-binding-like beta-propeller repeat protein [Bdellovibrionota bacterium]|nr:PQQ-binding-like beta-propeller repeat protein [Bdellovibrionota bacterium]
MKKNFLFAFLLIGLVSCSFLKNKLHLEGPGRTGSFFRILWSKNHDPGYQTGNLPVALSGPLAHEGIVYAGHNNGEMRAYEIKTGKKIWVKKDGGEDYSTPIIYEDLLIYGTGQGRLFSRKAINGELKYSVELGSRIETQGVIYKGRLYLHLKNHMIFCLDAKTGEIIWSYKRAVSYKTTLQRASRPLLRNNRLYVGFADGFVAAFSALDGSLVWEKKIGEGSKFIDVDSSPKIFFGKLFIGSSSGVVYVLDPGTGKSLGRLAYSSLRSLELIDNEIFLGTKKGKLIVLDENLNVLRESKNLGSSITNFLPWKRNKVLAGTLGGRIYALEKKDLSVVDVLDFGHPSSSFFGKSSTDEGYIAILSSRNRLHLVK